MSKKKFVFPDKKLSKVSVIFIVSISTIIVVVNVLVFGVGYYKAYHPDYEYEKISKQVNYHVYKPTYLPAGIEQASKFYINEKEFMGNNSSVRTYYDVPISSMAKGVKPNLIVINQTKVDTTFDVRNFVLSTYKGDSPPIIQPITLNSFPNRQAYLQTGGFAKLVYVITPDNVLISIAAVSETEDSLQKISNSLK